MDDQSPRRRFYVVNHKQDTPVPGNGLLIPQKKQLKALPARSNLMLKQYSPLLLVPLLAGIFFLAKDTVFMMPTSNVQTAALPQVALTLPPLEDDAQVLHYGVQVALTQPNFFAETRDAFIEAETTFIEVDLETMSLRFFENGILNDSMRVLAKGEVGSWWQTPAGLYKVEFKKEDHFSAVGQVYHPWTLAFQGNFFIHGWPTYADGTDVSPDFSVGGIRLENEDAKRLYKKVSIDTPILIHEDSQEEAPFVYEPKVPELKTPHYLIADVLNSTVLASSDLDAVAPIASVSKLMTALVAAEHINLDSSVFVDEPSFVQSLIPRLGDRSRVSMYSLLQLLLVESSNEAAEVIAAELGSKEFIDLMNKKARALGMMSTHFADPSGISAENTSSLSDLLRLAQHIYTNRRFIFELTANQDLPTIYVGGEFGELVNFNKVQELENFIGGKVGETIAAGQTSVTLHRIKVKDTERILAIIILGSENRGDDVRALLQYAEERFGN